MAKRRSRSTVKPTTYKLRVRGFRIGRTWLQPLCPCLPLLVLPVFLSCLVEYRGRPLLWEEGTPATAKNAENPAGVNELRWGDEVLIFEDLHIRPLLLPRGWRPPHPTRYPTLRLFTDPASLQVQTAMSEELPGGSGKRSPSRGNERLIATAVRGH